jgi:hypothetical protein
VPLGWLDDLLGVRRIVLSRAAPGYLAAAVGQLAAVHGLSISDDATEPQQGDLWLGCVPKQQEEDTSRAGEIPVSASAYAEAWLDMEAGPSGAPEGPPIRLEIAKDHPSATTLVGDATPPAGEEGEDRWEAIPPFPEPLLVWTAGR